MVIHFVDTPPPCQGGSDITGNQAAPAVCSIISNPPPVKAYKYTITVNNGPHDDPHVIVDNQVIEGGKKHRKK
jgi:hypothetical protein